MIFMRLWLRKTELWCEGFDNDVGLVCVLVYSFVIVLLNSVVVLLAADVVVFWKSPSIANTIIYYTSLSFIIHQFCIKFIVIINNIIFIK